MPPDASRQAAAAATNLRNTIPPEPFSHGAICTRAHGRASTAQEGSDPQRELRRRTWRKKPGAVDVQEFDAPRDRADAREIDLRWRRLTRDVSHAARGRLECGDEAAVVAVIVPARHRQSPEPRATTRCMVTRRARAGLAGLRRVTGEQTRIEHDRGSGDRDGDGDDRGAKSHVAPIITIAAAADQL